MAGDLTRRVEIKDIAQPESFFIGSMEDMGRFTDAYLGGMQKFFRNKEDLVEATANMHSRLIGLKLDMEFADLFKAGFSIEAKVEQNGSMTMVIKNPFNNKNREFLNFEFHDKEKSEIQPTEGHRWFYTQAFVEAGSFLRGIAFIVNEK